MSHYSWREIPSEQLGALLIRQVIHTSRLTIAKLILKKGAIVPLHHHENEQVTMLESGALLFEISGVTTILRGGEALAIPPDAPHRVEALEDSLATDVFTPVREDWVRGDDAYLRG